MPSQPPSFQEYQQALQRLRRRAHLRRAAMFRGVTTSVEMPCFDEEESRDQKICQIWNESNGFCPEGF